MDDIVISGISGRFPECDSVEELKAKLFAGIDLVTADNRRWPIGTLGLPPRSGKLKELRFFDATFFGVHAKQANAMDPQLRLLLEATFETILDAGVNPEELRGSNTGVFIGATESDSLSLQKDTSEDGFCTSGGCRSMFSSRLSYTFDFKGPSISINTACSSSMVALDRGVAAIQAGECDAAIIGGSVLCLDPHYYSMYQKLGILSTEGKCKAFDASGAGYVRSEAVCVLFLQKSAHARRIYATILGVKTGSDGYKIKGISNPSSKMQSTLARSVCEQANVNPHDVAYVEAHGTGTKVGDPAELNGIADVFCINRKEPLLIGALKSNMGHAEPASGICSIAKVIISMETGVIPANLHFQAPNVDIPALIDGRLKVVTENQAWNGGIVAINSFGFGGSNAHVLLRSNPKPKLKLDNKSIPRLVTVSGCTEKAVEHLLEKMDEHQSDSEFLGLINKIHSSNITGHQYRGYKILGCDLQEVKVADGNKRPIWFVYSGAGSQYPGIAKQMMKIDCFKDSITRLSDCMARCGVNIMDMVNDDDGSSLDNVLNMFVYIVAVQIALTDALKALGIEPDGVIGHSVGEIGCGYADGALTADQTLQIAYERGRAILETVSEPGAMAAVELTWDECVTLCPPDIFPACHNGKTSVTVSGPSKSIEAFIKHLNDDKVTTRRVNSSGQAFHSKYTAPAAVRYKEALDKILPNPKRRSPKWVSTCYPKEEWDQPANQLCSPDYHVNNFLSPVLFYEALQHIPKNAIVIELAPHSILQPIIRETLSSATTYCSLTKRKVDNVEHFLSNIGRIYNSGAQPKIGQLYPPVSFPVGRGTQMISPLIEWNHSTTWKVASYAKTKSNEEKIKVSLELDEHKYLAGHVIDGRNFFPASGYLVYAWKTLAKLRNQELEKTAVIIDDFRIHRPVILRKEGSLKLLVNIFKGSGEFEISESGSVVASGIISIPEDDNQLFSNVENILHDSGVDALPLTSDDVYKESHLRGYEIQGLFKSIIRMEHSETEGKIQWSGNWVTFIDSILQFFILSKSDRRLSLPTAIQRIAIDPRVQIRTAALNTDNCLSVGAFQNGHIFKSGGIELQGIQFDLAPRRQAQDGPKLESYEFIPALHTISPNYSNFQQIALTITSQMVLENRGSARNMKIVEISSKTCLAFVLKDIIDAEVSIVVDYTVIDPSEVDRKSLKDIGVRSVRNDEVIDTLLENANLVVLPGSFKKYNALPGLHTFLKSRSMFLLVETETQDEIADITKLGLEIVSVQSSAVHSKSYVLLCNSKEPSNNSVIIQVTTSDFTWLKKLKTALRQGEDLGTKIFLVSQNEPESGLVGLVNCLRQEVGGDCVRAYYIQSKTAEPFSLSSDFYVTQIKKDLIHNVLNDQNIWGTFRHLPLLRCDEAIPVKHAYVDALVKGDLSTIKWIQSPLEFYVPKSDAELCTVYYAALNFRDIMVASGKLPSNALPGNLATKESVMGLEFSGRDSKDRRVMGMLPALALATTCLADPDLLLEVPEHWSLEEAATVPFSYGTSYYALIVRGQLQPGESVLIHSGAGDVGQAAISIAFHMGCTIFTTVGTQSERDFLKTTFPLLNDANIGNSRDTSFEQLVMTKTKEHGVNLVLNSLAGEQLQASVRCLGEGGRFLEIGKVDLLNNSSLVKSMFYKNSSFHGILFDSILNGNSADKKQIVSLIVEGVRSGAVKPLPKLTYPPSEVEEAFRFMASGKHVGKVLLRIQDEGESSPKTILGIRHTHMDPNLTYIVTGGLGGFGLELAAWLISRGVQKLILTSRTGIRTGYQAIQIKRWRKKQIKVLVSTTACKTKQEAETLLIEANKLGPVGGIFNLAAVLKDAAVENQTENNFAIVKEAKTDTVQSLDAASRVLAPKLKYFVAFSSLASGRGNFGQSNYGFANSAIERICETRRLQGLPGLAIQWGAIDDVGMFQERLGKNFVISGSVPQRIGSCLAVLDILLQQTNSVVSSMVPAERNAYVKNQSLHNVSVAIGKILHIKDTNGVSKSTTFASLGMDSLMTTEIKQTLEQMCGIFLNVKEISNLTFGKLEELSFKSRQDTKSSTMTEDLNNNQEVFDLFDKTVPKKVIFQMSKAVFTIPQPTVLVIPSIEYSAMMFNSLSSFIDLPIFALQCTSESPLTSISKLVKYYLSYVKSIDSKEPYLIVAQHLSACIAYEIGLQLDALNKRVKLVLLDDSNDYQEKFFEGTVKNGNEKQAKVLAEFALKFNNFEKNKVITDLLALEDYNSQLVHISNILSSYIKRPVEDIKESASRYCRWKLLALNYKPSSVFQGEVILVRTHTKAYENFYGLNLVDKPNVTVHVLNQNYSSISEKEYAKEVSGILQKLART